MNVFFNPMKRKLLVRESEVGDNFGRLGGVAIRQEALNFDRISL